MATYSFLKRDGSTTPPVLEVAQFSNELEARLYAYQLLREGPKYKAVEVSDGIDEAFTVERPARKAPPEPERGFI